MTLTHVRILSFLKYLKNELITFNKIVYMHWHWQYLGLEYRVLISNKNIYKQLRRLTYARITAKIKMDKI